MKQNRGICEDVLSGGGAPVSRAEERETKRLGAKWKLQVIIFSKQD
jgi:hypothetical protein